MHLDAYSHLFRYIIYFLLNVAILIIYFKNNKKYHDLICLIAIVFILLLPDLADTKSYYETISSGHIYTGAKYEYLWRLLQWTLLFLLPAKYVLLSIKIIIIYLYARVSDYRYYGYMITSSAIILVTQNAIRQGISSVFLFFALKQNKLIYLFILSFIAFLIHNSSLYFLPLIFLVHFYVHSKLNYKNIIFVSSFCLIILFIFNIEYFSNYIAYYAYFRNDEGMPNRIFSSIKYFLYIFDYFLILFLYIINLKYIILEDFEIKIFYLVGIIMILILIVVYLYNSHDLAARLGLFNIIFITFLYANLIFKTHNKKFFNIIIGLAFLRNILSINAIKILLL